MAYVLNRSIDRSRYHRDIGSRYHDPKEPLQRDTLVPVRAVTYDTAPSPER